MNLSHTYAGASRYESDYSLGPETLLVAIVCRVGGGLLADIALLDTASHWCILPRRVAELLEIATGEDDPASRLETRFGRFDGRLVRLPLEFPAAEGQPLSLQATWFVCPDWPGPMAGALWAGVGKEGWNASASLSIPPRTSSTSPNPSSGAEGARVTACGFAAARVPGEQCAGEILPWSRRLSQIRRAGVFVPASPPFLDYLPRSRRRARLAQRAPDTRPTQADDSCDSGRGPPPRSFSRDAPASRRLTIPV